MIFTTTDAMKMKSLGYCKPKMFAKMKEDQMISFIFVNRICSVVTLIKEKFFSILYLLYMEKDSYALFVDNSGSVGGSANYWGTVQNIIAQYAKDISHYYLWNSNCNTSSLKELDQWILSKKGTGGTSPEYVASTIIDKKFTHVILVTDG